MHSENASYFRYWGKAKKDQAQTGDEYHLLVFHCLDVAAVGQQLLAVDKKLTQDLADFLTVTPKQLQSLWGFLLALHDLGKFASAFQALYSCTDDKLLAAKPPRQYKGDEYRHDRMGLYFWQKVQAKVLEKVFALTPFDPRNGVQAKTLKSLLVLMECTLGHHGQPIDKNDPPAIKIFTEPDNLTAVQAFVDDLLLLFAPDFPLDKLTSKDWRERLKLVSWQLAGMAVLADWIGSDKNFFVYKSSPASLQEYWQQAQETARRALAATDLDKAPVVKDFQSIEEHFDFSPTPLQHWAEQAPLDASPQLFILEDVTGAGKTEAALALTHRLMQSGAADGFYFGLPTMATSNAMFSRVAEHYQQMLGGDENTKPSIVLAHGAREMNDLFREAVIASGKNDRPYHVEDETATAQCNQWLADSRKKALLAPVGVGTIDQALLAVLPRRHQSLRLLGLNRKVLIFDEVHAADEYMFELLESLLALHLHQGGSAILLTATLSKKQRQRLVNIWLNEAGIAPYTLQNQQFPLATQVTLNRADPVNEQALASREDVSRDVEIATLNTVQACVDTILTAVAKGQCVVWVRNSVNDALLACQLIKSQLADPEDCLLFHSRFVLQDRKVIEGKVLDIFGKEGNKKGKEQRSGKVLIATQVFQESLDADTDVMISDICPIDDLIQRAGRLHRHTRNEQGVYHYGITDARTSRKLYLHAPEFDPQPKADWLSKNFADTQHVYRSPGRLWLGLRKLLDLRAIRMPSEARQLIESVYGEEAEQEIPEELKDRDNKSLGEARGKAAQAKSNLLPWKKYGYSRGNGGNDYWGEDGADISTRYSDRETVEVLLLKQNDKGQLTPLVEDKRFSVQLSTLKLAKETYADKLAPVPKELAPEVERLTQQFKQIKYLQLWLPETDPDFTYESATGFCERKNPR
ncbi:CRISPR-associated helicase/endonuclease Cas3 [Thalassomonas viridans]|uniref:CRISPR-associated helicase/endonuclease Cas3 n=1 Tax=Thalassomonas viridans TaxID=137584 RepID=A0AAE9Z2B2_9GAMM|nr:CRISPR-associated helicase/endonuclease Cas3 [Thalassomonas viridans]WDE04942.1 CRISPR-associated helicase/endonuclease Cas3 [Thalassomonas viridans]